MTRRHRSRRPVPAILALLLLLFVSFSLAAQQIGYRITGKAVSARDGSPIPHCRITASLIERARGGRRSPAQTEADDRGRFTLDLPSEGHWRLSAAARNFHSQAFDSHEDFSTAVVLTPAQPTYDLVFRAVPDAVLTGIVTDEAGEPVRSANINLFGMDSSSSFTGSAPVAVRLANQTDDRGRYEFAGLAPGSYMVNVQARPWYAASGPSHESALDPSLDVVYPLTWYPGVTDDASASQLTAAAGDRLAVDFSLLPVPSAHLRVAVGASLPARGDANPDEPSFRFNRALPSVTQLLPNGVEQAVFTNASNAESGEIRFDGLPPGTYQVTQPATGGDPAHSSLVHILAAGAVATLGTADNETTLTLTVDGSTGISPSEISLTDTVTGRVLNPGEGAGRPGRRTNPARPRPSGSAAPPRRSRDAANDAADDEDTGDAANRELTLQVPPGRYAVALGSDANAFVTGLSATGAAVTGHLVTVGETPVHLQVHLASGFATVDGFALQGNKPAVGALVLLVPATLGNPASLTLVARDQTDTDGGFHLAGVIPGKYILVAIDHGWGTNWHDAATLRRFLLAGTPLDLTPSAAAHPRIHAVAP